jgi:ATP-binding cassette, subfamily B, multidrug efflux pump
MTTSKPVTRPWALIDVAPHPDGVQPLPNRLGPFLWYFLRQGKWPLLLIMLLEGVAVGLNALAPLFYKQLVTLMSAPGGLDGPQALGFFLLMIGVLYVLQPLFSRVSGYLGWPLFFVHLRERVRMQLTMATRAHSVSFFTEDFAGRLASKIREGGYAVTEVASIVTFTLWGFVLTLVITATLLLQTHPVFLGVFVGWLGLYGLYLWWYLPRLRVVGKHASETHSKTSGLVVDTLTNIGLVKLFGRNTEEDRYLQTYARNSAHASYVNHRVIQFMWVGMAGMTLLLGVPMIGLVVLGLQQGWLALPDAVLALTLLPQVIGFAWWTAEGCSSLFENLSTAEDAMEALAKPYAVVDAPDAKPLMLRPDGGSVTFANVHFHYGRDAAEGTGLHGLNLVIPAGQKVGLVGRSGAGKSTLVNLLLRFYDLAGGEILLDGRNIAHVTQDSLRRHIAMVTQDSSLMHRSIADNLRYGKPDATDAELVVAAKRAHAHDFILSLEDKAGRKGYDAHVGERGVKLSGGQRQRIAIARVILEDAPILLLDEATSALDSEVEAAIQEEMQALMVGKTTIAIAHRLSTIAQMDRLVVMDRGRIVEDGTHAELLARGGLYASLWQRQSGGFIAHD